MLVKKTQRILGIVFCGILIVSIFTFVISQESTIQNTNNTPLESYNKNNCSTMKKIYTENKEYFDLIVDGFSDKFKYFDLMAAELSNASNVKNKISGMYYMKYSKLTLYEYINYKEYTYESSYNNASFDFSEEQIEAFYYIFDKLNFDCIEFFIYNDGTYNLFFKKDLTITRNDNTSSQIYSEYGLSYSSKNAPDEYYNKGEIFEGSGWKYAFFGYT